MDSDAREICLYLKQRRGQFIHKLEISRSASGRRRHRDEPDWAVAVLRRLVEKGILEADSTGHYRLRPPTKRDQPKRWISPRFRSILEQSGKGFATVFEVEEQDEFLNA